MIASRVSLTIDMPAEPEHYLLVESSIQDLIHAASPERVVVATLSRIRGYSFPGESTDVILLYLSYRYFTDFSVGLASLIRAYFRTKRELAQAGIFCCPDLLCLDRAFSGHFQEPSPSDTKACHGMNPYVADRAVQIITEQYADLSLETLAEQLKISRSYLCRILSGDTGYPFLDLLHFRRILAAVGAFLGADSDSSMEEISLRLGYASVHHFHRVFKRYTGMTPASAKNGLIDYTTPLVSAHR